MNKMVKIGIVCLIVALGLVFAGCEEFTKAEFGSVGKVGNVAYTGSLSASTLVITWDAASGGEGSYDIVAQQVGKKDIFNVYIYGHPVLDTSYNIPNTDKWTTDKLGKSDFQQGGISLASPTKIKIGVRASSVRYDKNPSIVWLSDEFDF